MRRLKKANTSLTILVISIFFVIVSMGMAVLAKTAIQNSQIEANRIKSKYLAYAGLEKIVYNLSAEKNYTAVNAMEVISAGAPSEIEAGSKVNDTYSNRTYIKLTCGIPEVKGRVSTYDVISEGVYIYKNAEIKTKLTAQIIIDDKEKPKQIKIKNLVVN